MIKIRGRYTGENIVLLDPISLPPNTEVEILVPDVQLDVQEQLYWDRLVTEGLIKEIRPKSEEEESYIPIKVVGKPLSETIIEERR